MRDLELEEREQHLELPANVDVFMVDNGVKLAFIEHHLKQCLNSALPMVGLDAEWSPYVLTSR